MSSHDLLANTLITFITRGDTGSQCEMDRGGQWACTGLTSSLEELLNFHFIFFPLKEGTGK